MLACTLCSAYALNTGPPDTTLNTIATYREIDKMADNKSLNSKDVFLLKVISKDLPLIVTNTAYN